MPVVAGLSLAGGPLAAAGGVHKVVHDNPHDGRRALKLSARDRGESLRDPTPQQQSNKQKKEKLKKNAFKNVIEKECKVPIFSFSEMNFAFKKIMESQKKS